MSFDVASTEVALMLSKGRVRFTDVSDECVTKEWVSQELHFEDQRFWLILQIYTWADMDPDDRPDAFEGRMEILYTNEITDEQFLEKAKWHGHFVEEDCVSPGWDVHKVLMAFECGLCQDVIWQCSRNTIMELMVEGVKFAQSYARYL